MLGGVVAAIGLRALSRPRRGSTIINEANLPVLADAAERAADRNDWYLPDGYEDDHPVWYIGDPAMPVMQGTGERGAYHVPDSCDPGEEWDKVRGPTISGQAHVVDGKLRVVLDGPNGRFVI